MEVRARLGLRCEVESSGDEGSISEPYVAVRRGRGGRDEGPAGRLPRADDLQARVDEVHRSAFGGGHLAGPAARDRPGEATLPRRTRGHSMRT